MASFIRGHGKGMGNLYKNSKDETVCQGVIKRFSWINPDNWQTVEGGKVNHWGKTRKGRSRIIAANHQDRAGGCLKHPVGHTAQEKALQVVSTPGAHHDKVAFLDGRELYNGLSRRTLHDAILELDSGLMEAVAIGFQALMGVFQGVRDHGLKIRLSNDFRKGPVTVKQQDTALGQARQIDRQVRGAIGVGRTIHR